MNLSGVSDAILGGWTTNAIVYLSTGVPIASPTSGVPIGYFNQRADVTCNPASGAPHTVEHWFNDNCFAVAGNAKNGATYPTLTRLFPEPRPAYLDHVRTRGARDLDLSIYKTFNFGETKALRFDVSSYNISNTPQYGYPTCQAS